MPVAELTTDTWYELMRACRATPLTSDGRPLPEEEDLSPGRELRVVEERDDRLLVESRGSAPASDWRYLVERADFELAITPPDDLPRSGQAPTASSNTAGSPD